MYQSLSKLHGSSVSFDATGSVVRRLSRPTDKSGHIFLYQGVLSAHTGVHTPVVQMLSEKHNIDSIANWLSVWHRAGAQIPKEAVSDFSLALLGALVKAFTPQPDLRSFINTCFGVLLGHADSRQLPPCFIRVDVAHCIKLITRWECLQKKGTQSKGLLCEGIRTAFAMSLN